MGWLREAVSDDQGLADMAYISIGALTVAALMSLAFILTMSAIDYATCTPISTVSKGDQSTVSVIPCRYDPLPTGQAAGLIFGAFGALIGALAGYMAATRRQPRVVSGTVTTTTDSTVEVKTVAPVAKAKPKGKR